MNRKKVKFSAKKKHITRNEIISFLKTGMLMTIAVVLPGGKLVKGAGYRARELGQYYQSSIDRSVNQLLRKGVVSVKMTEEGYVVTITEQGRSEILRYNLASMSVPKQKPWDNKWRMVFFDIEASNDKTRKRFQNSLISFGFYQMQKSVYIHPYPCQKEIQFLREVLEVPHGVKFATVESIENDEDLRSIFELSK